MLLSLLTISYGLVESPEVDGTIGLVIMVGRSFVNTVRKQKFPVE